MIVEENASGPKPPPVARRCVMAVEILSHRPCGLARFRLLLVYCLLMLGRLGRMEGDLALFIHEVVWSELMGGDEAVGLA